MLVPVISKRPVLNVIVERRSWRTW